MNLPVLLGENPAGGFVLHADLIPMVCPWWLGRCLAVTSWSLVGNSPASDVRHSFLIDTICFIEPRASEASFTCLGCTLQLHIRHNVLYKLRASNFVLNPCLCPYPFRAFHRPDCAVLSVRQSRHQHYPGEASCHFLSHIPNSTVQTMLFVLNIADVSRRNSD
jgi:hypothetical protein